MREKENPGTPVVANLQYGGEYRSTLEDAQKTGQCIFCKPEFQAEALKRVDDWMIVKVKNEYQTPDRKGGKPLFQFLFVRVSHGNRSLFPAMLCAGAIGALRQWYRERLGLVNHGSNLSFPSARDFAAIGLLLQWCKRRFGFNGGGFCIRDGDPRKSGMTVLHPHMHYIVPRAGFDPDNPTRSQTIPVDFPVG